MPTQTERLLQLAAQYRARAEALELAARELNGHAKARAVATLPAKLATAIGARRGRPPKHARQHQEEPPATKKTRYYTSNIKKQRERTAAMLKRIADAGGKGLGSKQIGRQVGSLVRRGYVQKAGDVYIRTAKEFVV